ncbi:MAG: molybdenum ABC transporter ATP-binding protein [Rhodobacteraceae bacterium]|nr:molybdenum ABC transporter ATP-binding protein [Paracoccaceae bacterium]
MTGLDLNIRLQRLNFTLEIDLDIALSGITALFGRSGAGKSSLLRVIGGFERAEGRLRYGGSLWQDRGHFVPPYRRGVATVFQSPTLFAHLDVAGNLAFAARRAGRTGDLAAMAGRFGLTALLKQPVHTLSGGEAQRVALARALLTDPKLILMDEPISALDQAARSEILQYIEALRDETKVPILYVSHSVAEVARLADRILLLEEGRVLGFGPTAAILSDNAAGPAFGGEEPGSLISARVAAMTADGLCALRFSGGTILTPDPLGAEGTEVRLLIRARDVMLATERPAGISALNVLPATVSAIEPVGPVSALVRLDCGGTALGARITQRSVKALGLTPGAPCHAILKTVALARD